MTMEINILKAEEYIKDTLLAGLVPNLSGSPGIGKSDIIRKVAEDFNLQLIDFRLAQADPTDLNGFPSFNKDTGRCFYAPPEIFPLETDELPDNKDGWLLFMDEMNSAPMSVQAAAYKVILDKMVGQKKLHPNVAIACAGNLTTDRAIVNRLSTAMQSRVIHLILEVDHKAWIAWAHENAIDYRAIAFIQFRSELLHKFDPSHADNTFPCPRTWHFLSKLIIDKPDLDGKLPLLAGTVGEGAAHEFLEFSKIYGELPTISEIIRNPDTLIMPEEPSTQYAIGSLISKEADAKNISALMKFVNRMPIEFQIISLQGVVRRKRELLQDTAVREWISENARELI